MGTDFLAVQMLDKELMKSDLAQILKRAFEASLIDSRRAVQLMFDTCLAAVVAAADKNRAEAHSEIPIEKQMFEASETSGNQTADIRGQREQTDVVAQDMPEHLMLDNLGHSIPGTQEQNSRNLIAPRTVSCCCCCWKGPVRRREPLLTTNFGGHDALIPLVERLTGMMGIHLINREERRVVPGFVVSPPLLVRSWYSRWKGWKWLRPLWWLVHDVLK